MTSNPTPAGWRASKNTGALVKRLGYYSTIARLMKRAALKVLKARNAPHS